MNVKSFIFMNRFLLVLSVMYETLQFWLNVDWQNQIQDQHVKQKQKKPKPLTFLFMLILSYLLFYIFYMYLNSFCQELSSKYCGNWIGLPIFFWNFFWGGTCLILMSLFLTVTNSLPVGAFLLCCSCFLI